VLQQRIGKARQKEGNRSSRNANRTNRIEQTNPRNATLEIKCQSIEKRDSIMGNRIAIARQIE